MTLLYAFWPLDPTARPADGDLWGDPCPLDALACPGAGPFLTVVATPGALVFAADVSAMLRAYGSADCAADCAADRAACPVEAARATAHRVAAEAADEWAADAFEMWQCPDPDTYRTGALPAADRRAVRDGAEAAGHAAAAADFRPHVCGLVAALTAPVPAAPALVSLPARRLAA